MNNSDITQLRLYNQNVIQSSFSRPEEAVHWQGAVQAQDYASAKWGIACRIPGCNEQTIDYAIDTKRIVKTWVLRGTLHVVSSKDIYWLLDLLSPGIISRTKSRLRQLELDEVTLNKANKLLEKEMHGGNLLMRSEVFDLLEKNAISTQGQRGIHILHNAAMHQLICLSSFKGKQVTYTLLNEWVPEKNLLSKEESLTELAKRFFTSHGPATLQDFANWSGLNLTDSRLGLENVKSTLQNYTIEGNEYWSANFTIPDSIRETVFLLPAFDEFIVGYKDRSLMLDKIYSPKVISVNGIFFPTVVCNGKVIGVWKRTINPQKVIIEINPFDKLSSNIKNQIEIKAKEFSKYLGLNSELIYS